MTTSIRKRSERNWSRDLSIRLKLQGIVMVTCGAALVVAAVVFTFYDRATFLHAKKQDLSVSAKMIGSNSTAALTFHDPTSALEILSALQAKPYVISACIYSADGKVFAKYSRDPAQADFFPPPAQAQGTRVAGGRMVLFQDIAMNGDVIGAIYIEADLVDLRERLLRFVMIDFFVLLGSLLIAFVMSYRLQRLISDPIRELAETASSVSARENYSIRATKRSQDEIGALFDQFNEMLDRIQQRDIAIQKANDDLERRVAERTSYLNALIENSPLAIMVLDSEQKIQLCNPEFERLFQYTRKEVMGKPVDGLLAVGDLLSEARALLLRARSDKPIQLVTRRLRKDRTLVDVEIHTVGLVVNGEVAGSLVIYQDISVRKRAEEAMQQAKEAAEAASRLKSEFLANMSHEIRTPMNGILGMTDLALDTELTSEQRDYLGMVKTSADSLLQVINDILDFSKVEAGKLDIDTLPFILRDNVGDAMKVMGGRAHQKGLEMACDIAPNVPDAVEGDPGRLRQVLVNLVGNAIKFTERGEIVVRIQNDSETRDEVSLHFSVSDTGIGIPPNRQQAIFEAFTQADGTTTRRFGGTGLGLTISSRLVELMGGRIWVESEIGKGSTFHFNVRLRLQQEGAARPIFTEAVDLRDLPILVVDDNLTNRRILHQILLEMKMKPVSVESGTAALERLRKARDAGQPFALALIDAQMPDMDGFGLAEQIKGDPKLARIPLILLTSAGQRGDAIRCREAGIAAYLIKPIKQSDLFGAVRETIGAAAKGRASASLVTQHSLRETQLRLRILLAEDNIVNQRLASRLLEKQGHTVAVTGNGFEALRALEQHPFDLVIMDVQMPQMDGIEAAGAIRAKEKVTGGHIPIIAMTAHAMKGDEERCIAGGMDGYVSKPIQLKKLVEAIAALFPETSKTYAPAAQTGSPAPPVRLPR